MIINHHSSVERIKSRFFVVHSAVLNIVFKALNVLVSVPEK